MPARQTQHPDVAAQVPDAAPRSRSGRGAGRWRLELLTSARDLGALASAWAELHRSSGTEDPFAHPAWSIAWAERFTGPGDLCLVAVWEDERLVALAPFYRHRSGIGPLRSTRLRLLGSGHDPLTEMSQILAAPEIRRRATRVVLAYLHDHTSGWDWIEVWVPPEQGWLDPDDVPPKSGSFVASVFAQAFVIVPLPDSWEELRSQLKRNVTESIRRARNRLARDGHSWTVTELRGPGDIERGLSELLRLHRARATMTGRAPRRDRLADARHEEFVRDAVARMAVEEHATVYLLAVGGKPVGALLAMRAGGSTFLSLSGYDPDWWDYGILNLLTSEVLQSAVRDGDRTVNLSSGPENSKLRWSEQIAVHQLFAVVAGRRRSRLAFAAFLQARAASEIRSGSRVARAVRSEVAARERDQARRAL